MDNSIISSSSLSTKSLGLESREEIVNQGSASECYKYRPLYVDEICENKGLYDIVEQWIYSTTDSVFVLIGPSGCGKTTSIKLIVEKIGISYIYIRYKDFIKDFTFSRKSVLQQLNNIDNNRLVMIVVDGKIDEKLILEKAKKIKIIIISKSVVNIKKSKVYMFESPSRESMSSILSWMCIESGIDLDDNKLEVIEKLACSHDIRRAITSLFIGQRECPPIAWHDSDDDDLIRCYRVYETLDGPAEKIPVLLDTFCLMDNQLTQYPGYYFGAEIASMSCERFIAAEHHTINARCAQTKGRISCLTKAFFDLGCTDYTDLKTVSMLITNQLERGEIKSIPESKQSSWLTVMRLTNKVMNVKTRRLKNIIESVTVKGT